MHSINSEPFYTNIPYALTIFYVEDDEDDQMIFEDMLQDVAPNAQLQMFPNGLALLHAVNNPPPAPAVVFIDLNLPGINGFEVIERIKTSPVFSQLPLVVLSTSDSEINFKKSKELGASFYIVKPSNIERFKHSIYKALTIDWTEKDLSVDGGFVDNAG